MNKLHEVFTELLTQLDHPARESVLGTCIHLKIKKEAAQILCETRAGGCIGFSPYIAIYFQSNDIQLCVSPRHGTFPVEYS